MITKREMRWTWIDHEESAYRGIFGFRQQGYLCVVKLDRQTQEQFDDQCREKYDMKMSHLIDMNGVGCAGVEIGKNDFLDL